MEVPLGVPYGMACGQALQPCGLTGGLTTGSRLRRTRTPIWMKELKKAKRQQTKRFTIRAHARVHSTCQASTYLSGKSVQTNRATSVHLRRIQVVAKRPAHVLFKSVLAIDKVREEPDVARVADGVAEFD